jgi:hypothetical protein
VFSHLVAPSRKSNILLEESWEIDGEKQGLRWNPDAKGPPFDLDIDRNAVA